MKKHSALLLAFSVFCLLLLSGCKSLTPQEYRSELSSRFKEYSTAQSTVVKDIMAFDKNNGILENPAEFETHCKEFEDSMKAFDEMKPPSAYKDKHKELVAALDNEREWLSAVRAYIAATTDDEAEQATQRIQAAADYKNSFPEQMMDLILSLPSGE